MPFPYPAECTHQIQSCTATEKLEVDVLKADSNTNE